MVTLWEYVSAEASESSAASTTSSSTFYLDIRSQIGLPPSLLTDPLPHASAHGRTLSASTVGSSLGSLVHHFPSPPPSSKSGSASGGSSSASTSSDDVAIGKAKHALKRGVHVPLETGKREVEEAGKWIGIVKTVVAELEDRLKG